MLFVALALWVPRALGDTHHGCATTNPTASDANAHSNVARDCEILLDIESTLAGTATLNWDVATAMTGWDGVSVENTKGVTQLVLESKQLSGTLPPELVGLTELTRLLLAQNELTGGIPTEFGNFAKLANMSLSNNPLGGTIPSELGSIATLRSLDLDNGDLSGQIPRELGSLTALGTLSLITNSLTGTIPSELGSLTDLVSLRLEDNMLSGQIPSQLGSLSKLQALALYKNALTGSIPDSLGNLSELIELTLHGNQLTGSIPGTFGQLVALEDLNLQSNQLSGSIPNLGGLSNLRFLYFRDNALTGTIPSTLGHLSLLQFLDLRDNALTGTIPSTLGQLSELQFLRLSTNQLSGSIPASLGQINGLRLLDLRFNRLTGEIPASLGQLQSLQALALSDNQLSGPVPQELFRLPSVSFLWLSKNQLTGTIPVSDLGEGELASLSTLRLHCNRFSGLVPAALGAIASLQEIWLFGNEFDTPLPSGLGAITVYDGGPPEEQAQEACPPPPAPPKPDPKPKPKPDPKPKPKPKASPLLRVSLTGDPGPVSPGDMINYEFTIINAGNVGLRGVFWGSPELGVTRRDIGDGRLRPGASVVVPVTFGPVTAQHIPGPIIIRFFGDSDQTHAVSAVHSIDVRARAEPAAVIPTSVAIESQPVPVAPDPDPAPTAPPAPPAPTLIVERARFLEPDTHLRHNTVDLRVVPAADAPTADSAGRCNFLAYYDATGGLPCWGFPTSEVLVEVPGTLTQYFQRGVMICRLSDNPTIERLLVWDLIAGGLAGAPDLGAEPELLSQQAGRILGPWGHRVSNYAVDGTYTGFLDFFLTTGGVAFFGYPKTEARSDQALGAVLGLPDAAPGFIRQYFQAAVLEYHPGDPDRPIKLALLGDAVRDRLYPNQAHRNYASFGPADPVAIGNTYTPERVVPPDGSASAG